ncbi:hypothetical protein IPG41_00105 [Candidatus Peregrinibacteria bacterium]|nr:MAG: hypothetical protein IPG41_00105 [Candidatus Peregrinibacteria bacterium]
MNFLKKFLPLSVFILMLFGVPLSQAATGLLPGGDDSVADNLSIAQCFDMVELWTADYAENGYNGMPESQTIDGFVVSSEQMLTCALKSGNMQFWMLPYFINYALEFVINVAGILVVLMIVVGGYYYILGAVTEDKEKGKTIITYAIGGYVLVLVSWFIVNALLLLVTQ